MIEIPAWLLVVLIVMGLPVALLALLWLVSMPLSIVFKEKKRK